MWIAVNQRTEVVSTSPNVERMSTSQVECLRIAIHNCGGRPCIGEPILPVIVKGVDATVDTVPAADSGNQGGRNHRSSEGYNPSHIAVAVDIDEHASHRQQPRAVPKGGRVGRFAAMRFGKATVGRLHVPGHRKGEDDGSDHDS